MTTIDRNNLKKLQEREAKRFVADHPGSADLYKRAQGSLLGGVPMNWMKKWAGEFPVFVTKAKGAHFTDADGREYVDLCLGDTGAMTGHSPDVVVEAVAKRLREGITLMLPTEDALFVGQDLKKRFGLPYWQFTLTATDANRFSIRIAREITQRPKILVFHYCYHGTVDETFTSLHDGVVGSRRGNIGPPVNPAETTRVVEFNDLNALEEALKHHDVACILAEPAMTNVGIILPDEGYWKQARELARRYGALFIADETHTICAGPHRRVEARAGHAGIWQSDWQRDSRRGVRMLRRSGSAHFGADSSRRLRRRWNRRNAGGERSLSGRHARDPGACADGKNVRENDSTCSAVQ
jgi:glutamate-1-semialdehyde 2,1-aminomutase